MDRDGFGDPDASISACQMPSGHVTDATDCDDTYEDANPSAPEICEEGGAEPRDNDCDGLVDEGTYSVWYTDLDSDGFGAANEEHEGCDAPDGLIAQGGDCDDTNADAHPNAGEVQCNGVDEDCDGLGDDAPDGDGDGFDVCDSGDVIDPDGLVSDCDDGDPLANPAMAEVCDDGRDANCDPTDCEPVWAPDLADSDLTFIGEAEGDCLGFSLTNAGDLDGSGGDDVVLSSFLNSCASPADHGALYVFFDPVIDGGVLDPSQADTYLAGPHLTGFDIAAAGDVNGDGVDDLLVSAPEDVGYKGGLFLLLGPILKTDAKCEGPGINPASAVHPKGEAVQDNLSRVSGLGDINGDGLDDFMLGAPGNDRGSGGSQPESGLSAGAAYVYHGNTGGSYTEDVTDAEAILVGVAGDSAAHELNPVGDLNGDGLADVAVARPFHDPDGVVDAGALSIFFGGAQTLSAGGQIALDDADIVVVGIIAGETASISYSGAGDLNGDGVEDLLVGTAGGPAYLLLSPLRPDGNRRISLSDADVVLWGKATDNPHYVTRAGDLNGDGADDLLIGTPFSESSSGAARAYVVLGPLGDAPVLNLDQPGVADAVFQAPETSTAAGERCGQWGEFAVSSAGDLNSDGLGDILIGVPGTDSNGVDAGAVHLVMGRGQ